MSAPWFRLFLISISLSGPALAQTSDEPTDVIDTGIVVVSEEKQRQRKIAAGFTIGHLMSPAVSTLDAGEATIGTMAAGVGLSKRLTVAVSPWLLGFYNTNNIEIRYQDEPTKAESWGAQLAHFKTTASGVYDMEASSLWLQYRSRVSRYHRVHWNLNYMHFQNARVPFSLKRWSFNEKEPSGQLSFTTLQEVATTPQTRVCLELGLLGLNYHYVNYHFGASTAFRFEGGYLQFGFSATGYLSNITKSAYNQVYSDLQGTGASLDFTSVYKNSVAIHPEVQLQIFF